MFKNFNDLTPDKQLERWQNVLRVLKGLSRHEREKHFKMSEWGQKTSCGTVACAAGHCGLDPWFRRRGFRLNFAQNAADGSWYAKAFDPGGAFDPEGFFGRRGYKGVFLKMRADYKKTIENVKEQIAFLERQVDK